MGGSIDPIGYDVVELRELARVRGDRYVADGFLWTELPESFPPIAGTAGADRPSAWSGSLEERQKPYLRDLPDGEEGRRVARELVGALVERGGAGAAVEALAYYESLGWLTEAVREALEGYLLAVEYRSGGSLEDLTRADHVGSLARTARLAQLPDTPAGPDAADRNDASPDRETVDGDRDGHGDEGREGVDEDDRNVTADVGEKEDGEAPVDPDWWRDRATIDGDEPTDRGEDGRSETPDEAESGFEFGRSGE